MATFVRNVATKVRLLRWFESRSDVLVSVDIFLMVELSTINFFLVLLIFFNGRISHLAESCSRIPSRGS
jgi:hypothetical protein